MEMVKWPPLRAKKAGRPRAIPEEMESVVAELYERNYGYRTIARILRSPAYGLNPHYSSVRQTLMRLGKVRKRTPGYENLS